MEITKISKEEILKGLHIGMTDSEVNDYISKMEEAGLPKDFTEVIYAAYRKGVNEYQTSYWKEKSARELSDKKFSALSVTMAEQLIDKKVTSAMTF